MPLEPVRQLVRLDGHRSEHVARELDVVGHVRHRHVRDRDPRLGVGPRHVVVLEVVELLAEQDRAFAEVVGPMAEDPVALLAVEDEGEQLERGRHPPDRRVAVLPRWLSALLQLAHLALVEDSQGAPRLARQQCFVGSVGALEAGPPIHHERKVLGALLGKRVAVLQPEIQHPLLASAEVAANDDEGLKGVGARSHRPHAPADLVGRRVVGDLAQEIRSMLVQALPAERRAPRQVEQNRAHGLPPLDPHVGVLMLAEQPDQLIGARDVNGGTHCEHTSSNGPIASACISPSHGTRSPAIGIVTNLVAPALRKRPSRSRSSSVP